MAELEDDEKIAYCPTFESFDRGHSFHQVKM